MQVPAPAKINLTLRVRGKRPDGYHELESVMQMLTLADTLTIADADGLVFTSSDPALQTEANLAVRAARLLMAHCPTPPRGAKIHLEKAIPMRAGLGGGSSDAAAVLATLNEFWNIRLTLDRLAALAAQLGSDVPFFLDGPCSVIRGRGETVVPVLHHTAGHVVLAKPAAGLSTADVYARLHAEPAHASSEHLPETAAMIAALHTGDATVIARTLVNDLEAPAFALLPELARGRQRMLEEGCLGVILCGSGSALCGICPDATTAAHAALDLTNDFPWTATARFIVPPL
ncbi:MAG: 4-diphosphocytidyl-2-C-methyl-D-erythritol kinase [bacterium ADurb.Bin429]|nr:MAG: 4-diphosphocytidyl-2-C-methyl-D-erythritol kinase [bacterium ADurb.Bin429]